MYGSILVSILVSILSIEDYFNILGRKFKLLLNVNIDNASIRSRSILDVFLFEIYRRVLGFGNSQSIQIISNYNILFKHMFLTPQRDAKCSTVSTLK